MKFSRFMIIIYAMLMLLVTYAAFISLNSGAMLFILIIGWGFAFVWWVLVGKEWWNED